MTRSEKGAWLREQDKVHHVKAFSCDLVDATGAGDMFLGAYLYGISSGLEAETAAKLACYMAREVVSVLGARLKGDVKEIWQQALSEVKV